MAVGGPEYNDDFTAVTTTRSISAQKLQSSPSNALLATAGGAFRLLGLAEKRYAKTQDK